MATIQRIIVRGPTGQINMYDMGILLGADLSRI